MERDIYELVCSVYAPDYNYKSSFLFEKWLNNSNVRYFSLARYALLEALKLLNIKKGDIVAIPEFICRDLISSISSAGATTLFYPVDKSLNLSSIPKELYNAKVIVAVNYFGFPQDLTKFKEVVDKSNAILIEDNAHGFLSRDLLGNILGTRTPLSIFSLRKTVPLLNGAALVVNDSVLSEKLPRQVESDFSSIPFRIKIKQMLRMMVPFLGYIPCRLMTIATRLVRRIQTGSEIPIPCLNAEVKIPSIENPYFNLYNELSTLDTLEEGLRRRELYLLIGKNIRQYGGEPIFDKLPSGVVPYGFPFRANEEQIVSIKKYLKSIKLECNHWPDLPDDIVENAKTHYKNVWMVSFLW